MIKFIVFSMVLAIALASPAGESSPSYKEVPAWMKNNKCFSNLLSLKSLELTLANLVELIECLLDQVIFLIEQLLGGNKASSQSSLLIKLLNNLRSLLMNIFNALIKLLSGGGKSNADIVKGITVILESVTKALPGLKV